MFPIAQHLSSKLIIVMPTQHYNIIGEDSYKPKFWGCLTICNTTVLLLLSFGMFVAGAIMWSVINGYFGIVDDVDFVICKQCVICFTISTLILFIGSAVTIAVLICCFATNRHEFNSGLLITIFYTLAGVIAIISVIAVPIWLYRQNSILQRFEESSKVSFIKLSTNADIRVTWDNYQTKFGCCGVHDYKDYYSYFGIRLNNSIPMSCCNHTTLDSVGIECSKIVRNVTEKDISSYYIYGKGCSATVINISKLNSTTVREVGILAVTGSVYVLISVVLIFILTVVIIPEDNEQRFYFVAAVFIVLFAILRVFLAKN